MNGVLESLYSNYGELKKCDKDINAAIDVLIFCFESGGKLLLCGNGGSAADCDHIVGELMKGFHKKRMVSDEQTAKLLASGASSQMATSLQGALPTISLAGSSALSTAYSNDVNPEYVFAQQLWGLGTSKDVLISISTSGNAINVCNAAIVARAKGMKVIGLTSEGNGRLLEYCDVAIKAPASETYRIQEYHLPIYHAICVILENYFF